MQSDDMGSSFSRGPRVDFVGTLPPEIASAILNHLSPRDFLRAGRVCRKWRDVAAGCAPGWMDVCVKLGLDLTLCPKRLPQFEHSWKKLYASARDKIFKFNSFGGEVRKSGRCDSDTNLIVTDRYAGEKVYDVLAVGAQHVYVHSTKKLAVYDINPPQEHRYHPSLFYGKVHWSKDFNGEYSHSWYQEDYYGEKVILLATLNQSTYRMVCFMYDICSVQTGDILRHDMLQFPLYNLEQERKHCYKCSHCPTFVLAPSEARTGIEYLRLDMFEVSGANDRSGSISLIYPLDHYFEFYVGQKAPCFSMSIEHLVVIPNSEESKDGFCGGHLIIIQRNKQMHMYEVHRAQWEYYDCYQELMPPTTSYVCAEAEIQFANHKFSPVSVSANQKQIALVFYIDFPIYMVIWDLYVSEPNRVMQLHNKTNDVNTHTSIVGFGTAYAILYEPQNVGSYKNWIYVAYIGGTNRSDADRLVRFASRGAAIGSVLHTDILSDPELLPKEDDDLPVPISVGARDEHRKSCYMVFSLAPGKLSERDYHMRFMPEEMLMRHGHMPDKEMMMMMHRRDYKPEEIKMLMRRYRRDMDWND